MTDASRVEAHQVEAAADRAVPEHRRQADDTVDRGRAGTSGLAPAGCIGVTAAKIKRLKESSAEPNRLMRPIAHIVA
jgi:hypothetical protein